jgi:hypothetical protein
MNRGRRTIDRHIRVNAFVQLQRERTRARDQIEAQCDVITWRKQELIAHREKTFAKLSEMIVASEEARFADRLDEIDRLIKDIQYRRFNAQLELYWAGNLFRLDRVSIRAAP